MSDNRCSLDWNSVRELKKFLDGALAVFEGREGTLSAVDIQVRSLLCVVRRSVDERMAESSTAGHCAVPFISVRLPGGARPAGYMNSSSHTE
ncbi:MAG TPA: hypothetical protein VG936_05430 [Lacunisphaera sp.]|nr:hypothetical protein [Lacunisphaera sp.]